MITQILLLILIKAIVTSLAWVGLKQLLEKL